MFERFTDRARRAIVLAQEEARTLEHDYIGTEHLFLGLLHEGGGVAARALTSLGLVLHDVRARVEEMSPPSVSAADGHIPFTKRTKKAMEQALREALALGHDYIGTEHLLLGVLAVREGLPAELLAAHGVDADAARARVLELLTADTVNFSLGASGSSQSTDAPESAAAATARDSLSIRAATVPTMADVAAALAALPAEVASLREEIAALRAQLAGDPPRD